MSDVKRLTNKDKENIKKFREMQLSDSSTSEYLKGIYERETESEILSEMLVFACWAYKKYILT